MSRFTEIQRFPVWAEFLMIGIGMVMPVVLWWTIDQDPEGAKVLLVVIPVMMLVYLGLFRMKTEVLDDALVVTFGWLTLYRRRISLADIVSAEPVQYNPLRDYGGWGIRGIPVSALNARGNLGVQLTLRNGRPLLIGSQIPQALADAIRTAKTVH